MSYEKDKIDSFITSASVSTALAPYVTSASLSTALAPYATSASVATALEPYVTSASVATALANNRGMVLLGSLSISVGLAGTFGFSGSWSDYAMLEMRATYRPNGTSLTASAAIYTDGGTTAMLSIPVGTVSSTVFYHITLRAYNGGEFKTLQMENASVNARTQGVTATANGGFVNCMRLMHGTASSATISIGMVQLFGVLR
jgi:hypothetical protein